MRPRMLALAIRAVAVEYRRWRRSGARAVVVGCGLGADALHLSRLGFETTGFDVSETAIRLARRRAGEQRVDVRVANLLALPGGWRRSPHRKNPV